MEDMEGGHSSATVKKTSGARGTKGDHEEEVPETRAPALSLSWPGFLVCALLCPHVHSCSLSLPCPTP